MLTQDLGIYALLKVPSPLLSERISQFDAWILDFFHLLFPADSRPSLLTISVFPACRHLFQTASCQELKGSDWTGQEGEHLWLVQTEPCWIDHAHLSFPQAWLHGGALVTLVKSSSTLLVSLCPVDQDRFALVDPEEVIWSCLSMVKGPEAHSGHPRQTVGAFLSHRFSCTRLYLVVLASIAAVFNYN